MSKLKDKIAKKISLKINDLIGGLAQNVNSDAVCEADFDAAAQAKLRSAAARGAVLLKNDKALPFEKSTLVSVFGRVQLDWFYTGYGSGGDVKRPYQINLTSGIRACENLTLDEELAAVYEAWIEENPKDDGFWAHWPRFYPEMPLDKKTANKAAEKGGKAVVVIGRSSGEDRENTLEKGSYYLTDEEKLMLDNVCEAFDSCVVLLNIGCIMDLSWAESYGDKISALMIVWQGGMESGNAVADLLCGREEPSGRLCDCIAKRYDAYPSADCFGGLKFNNYKEDIYVGYRWFESFDKESVLYPFGFGLGYGSFELAAESVVFSSKKAVFKVNVKNVGERAARETAQLYVQKPCGSLGTPARELVAFAKSSLLAPGEEQQLELHVSRERLSSYDEAGETGFISSYVLQKGRYRFYLGGNVRDCCEITSFSLLENEPVEQLSEVSAPLESFDVFHAVEQEGGRKPELRPVRTRSTCLKQIILDNLPKDIPQTSDRGIKLIDVKEGRATLDEFTAQLSNDELEAISRGAYVMNHPLGVSGNAGVFGGVIESLRVKGIPPITTSDGPSGIRLAAPCTLLPIGTLLACSFDTEMVEELYCIIGEELVSRGSDVLLAPGLNIHRNPLCGRNFEYYSEDPLLTGLMAAAAVRGIQSAGASACPKHFACNNQEVRRNTNDSRLSERALREIYLKGFEICVKTAKPDNLMSSYNKINGVWGHYNYELCTTILRGEWGFEGNVLTDWWMRYAKDPNFPKLRDNAYRVRAQVDVLMPGGKRTNNSKPDGTLLKSLGKKNGITLGEIQRSAKNVLRFAMRSTAMKRFTDK